MCLQSVEGREFTAKDTAAAAAMYTFDFGGGRKEARQEPVQAAELCPGLEEGEGESKKDERIKGVRDALCLVMTALRKDPVVEGCVTLYQGARRRWA